MSAKSGVSRRQFLKASTAGAGFVLGLRLGWPSQAEAATAEFTPNAWIRVGTDGGITLVCARNEMGQDVHTSLVMLLAGSTSIRDAWDPLRRAGAMARSMLIGAAATRWKVPPGECRAQNGYVLRGDKKLAYGTIAAAAAREAVPSEVALKPASAFSVIGKPLPRLDGADKARGRTVFGIDVKQAGMVYAALAQCPVIGGRVASFDAEAARKRSGVRKIVDIGEGVAVIADHYWVARSALADVKIQWDEGPAATLDTASIYARLDQAGDRPGVPVKQAGDAAAILAKAKPLEARYTSQMLAHATLEPPNCLARVSRSGVDVWASTQFPPGAQAVAAEVAGVKSAQVRVHSQFIGGGFGRRLEVDFIARFLQAAEPAFASRCP